MKFSKLSIQNFRSIRDRIEIQFDPGSNLSALVGPNNAGKSNILSALALVLGTQGGPLGKRELEESDFYNHDTSGPIDISIYLSTPITTKNVYGKAITIEGFRLEGKQYKIGERKGELHTDHYCFGKNDKGNDESPLKDAESFKGVPKPILARRHIYGIGSLYVLDPTNLSVFFRMSGRGPLAELLDLYRDDFAKPANMYPRKPPEGITPKKAKDAFEEVAHELSQILRTERLEQIEDTLGRHVSEYLGLPAAAKFRIDLGVPEATELLDELVQLRIHEDPSLRAIGVSRIGTGYLSLFRLAVLQALSEVTERGNAIFIIEEPEAYLHPHLRRFFYRILQKLADRGDIIFYSTHAQEFVDLTRYRDVARVAKPSGTRTEVFQVPSGVTIDFDSLGLKLRGKGNQELYFADRVLLTEGQDDRIIFEVLLEKKGIPIDARSISVVDCGSKENIPDYVELCKALEIVYVALFDGDAGNPNSKVTTAKIQKATGNDTSKYHALPNTLEAALKTTKQDENWRHLLSLVDPLTYAQIASSYPDIHAAAEAFASTL